MSKDFRLPDLGEGIHEAQVVNVLVKEGDTVSEDQMVLEVETDKAAVELPIPFAGVVAKLNVKAGDTVTVGDVLLSIAEGGTAPKSAAEKPVTASRAKAAAAPARSAPHRAIAVQAEAGSGDDRVTVAVGGAVDHAGQPPASTDGRPSGEASRSTPVPAAPAVRRFARELGIDLCQVRGTAPGGRIVREDVERFQLAGPNSAAGTTTADVPAAKAPAQGAPEPTYDRQVEPLPDFSQWGPIHRKPIPQIRKAIARQMARAWTNIPHVTHMDEADVTDLETFRKEQGKAFAQQDARLSLTAFILKAAAGALQAFPHFNASFDETTWELVYKDYTHIGVAVDTPRGLMVPVLRDVDRKSLPALSAELKGIADRARDFKLDITEMRGGTFTVTNVGALGGTLSTPMINWPEVAILGLGTLGWKPVVRDGEVVPRMILPVFISFDHRVIDGADGARFLKAVITYLENPLNLLLVS